jgi:cob(I)alamin adenosyltransferase
MKIYTRTGDDGTTGLFGGRRVGKDVLRIEAYGTVDELNALLGLARAAVQWPEVDSPLARIQNQLFTLGADLATPLDATPSVSRITETHVAGLEEAIDEAEQLLEPLRAFILPGGDEAAALLHVCRTVCRRAERAVVALARAEEINDCNVRYLNRLSDFLFVLARRANRLAGCGDVPWEH